MTRRLPAVLAVALLAVVSMQWASAPAHAHAILTASAPADGSSVERPPTEALLTFNETPDPVLSGVRVLDASGRQVEASEAETVAGQPAQLRVPLGVLALGAYTISWRVTSVVDGHTTVGSVAFGVGVPVVAEEAHGAPDAARDSAPTGASVAGRWLFYVGVVLMLGAAVFGVVVVADPVAVSRWLLVSAWAAAAAGLLLTTADYRAGTATSLANLLSSPTGQKLTRQAAAVVVAGVAVVWVCLRRSRSSLAAVGVGASAAMLARALAGHANASSLRGFAVAVQWVHLVAVGAWVGGLVWLLVAMRRGDPGRGPGLVRRFSTVAAVMLAVVAVSGTLRAIDEVGGWSGLFDTGFGVTLLLKFGLFASLVALGALSRFRHVPAASARRIGGLRRAVRAEVAIAAGVLAATAVLAGLPPSTSVVAARAGPAPSVTVTGHDYATSVRVRLVVTPGSAGPNSFDATVTDYDSGDPVPAETVSLRFRLDDRRDVVTATLDLTRHPDSHWRGSGSMLSIDGRWRVTALVQTATDAVEVPMELVTRRSGPADMSAPVGQEGCGRGTSDPAYSVTVGPDPDPPRAEGTTFRVDVRRDGKPVTEAKVCVSADMPDMQHPGVNTVAREVSAGRYDAELEFSMTGAWTGSVTIVEPGQRAISVPLVFEVE